MIRKSLVFFLACCSVAAAACSSAVPDHAPDRTYMADNDPAARTHFVTEHPWMVFYDESLTEQDVNQVTGYSGELKLVSGKNVKGKPVMMVQENQVNLDKELGLKTKEGRLAILVNEIYAPRAGIAYIGATAEWWMRLYVNAKEVYSTWNGNGDGWSHIEFTNHIFPVQLKAGRNLVVMLSRSGRRPWIAAFGAAPEIPKSWTRKEVTELFFKTDSQIECGPWITAPAADSVTVSFLLPFNRRAGIEYRKKGTQDWTKVWQYTTFQKKSAEFFRFELNGLEPDTPYEYRVMTIEKNTVRSPVYEFRTWSDKPQTLKMALVADQHLHYPHQIARLEKVYQLPGVKDADVFVTLGDSVSTTNDFRGEYLGYFMKGFLKYSGHGQYLFPVRGNHECRGDESSEFGRYFKNYYYSARMGDVFLIVLDSGEYNDIFNKDDPDATYNVRGSEYFAEQRKWLEETVRSEACRTAKFRIVMLHAPLSALAGYERQFIRPMCDGLLASWDRKKQPEVLTHLWIAGHKHYPWCKHILGINELELDGPNGIGCATVEAGKDSLRVKSYQARWQKLITDVTITPDGKMTSNLPDPPKKKSR